MEHGDFDALVRPTLPELQAFVRRMVGHPEDTRDLVQDTLLRAYESIDGFRGEASFKTWLFAIATRRCIDHLRARRRWSWDAQEAVRKQLYAELGADGVRTQLLGGEGYRFDAREHIAFCFTCVGRSLDADEQASLVLSEVFALGDGEAARALGLSESTYRHRLSAARKLMHERFEGLCGLVNKNGVCYQCKGLRMQAAATERGPELPSLGDEAAGADDKRRLRLAVVRDGDVHHGVMQPFHDRLWQALDRFAEQNRE
jgi:RNA polymerase sigma-70 factor, ECF subfamily